MRRGMVLRLPALTRDLEIDYTALSFIAPSEGALSLQAGGVTTR